MNRFRFVPNVPAILSLASTEENYDSDTETVSYALSDGSELVLPRMDAARLNMLELKTGETFGICKRYQDEKMVTTETTVWLTPQTEQARAATEQPATAKLPEPPRKPVQRRRKVQEIVPAIEIAPTQGTGTHGPAPLPKLATMRQTPIPWNIAFREVAALVARELAQIGEQWSDQARQDAVSTILIAESKAGRITTWER